MEHKQAAQRDRGGFEAPEGIEDAVQQPAAATRYSSHGAIPPVAPLHDQAAAPSASQRAYGELADDAGPSSHRFAGEGKLHSVEEGFATLKLGDTGSAVRRVQQALFDLDYRPIAVTGTFDQDTADRVKDFQTKQKVGARDGTLDGTTFAALEHQLGDLGVYANAAHHGPPGLRDTPKGSSGRDVPALLSETHALDADDKAAANAVISPSKADGPVGPFVEKTAEGHYGDRLETALTDQITSHAHTAQQRRKEHDDGRVFSMKTMDSVGNAAKREVDKVFGAFAVGGEMNEHTLKDRYEADNARFAREDGGTRLEEARSRARYFMNTLPEFAQLDKEHSVDRTRAQEAKIIDGVLNRVTAAHEGELLMITATWSASTDKHGIISIQRVTSGSEEGDRDMLWTKFGTMIHEYIHSLAHQKWRSFKSKTGGADSQAGTTLTEGVTEFLTRTVITQINPGDEKLQRSVLGSLYDGETPTLERDAYTEAFLRAQGLVGVVGIHNLYAAYFLGEVELVGG